MSRLLLATRNQGKLVELQGMLRDEGLELASLADFPELGEIEETGKTFEENARIKATEAARATGTWALGEDSGLEVDALEGRPGIYSARFSGVHGDDRANNQKLIEELTGHRDRAARYVCCMALAGPDGRIVAASRGVCEGRIGHEARGDRGFGYDPYFLPEGSQLSMAELEPATKDLISHRGQALRAMVSLIRLHVLRVSANGSPEAHTLR